MTFGMLPTATMSSDCWPGDRTLYHWKPTEKGNCTISGMLIMMYVALCRSRRSQSRIGTAPQEENGVGVRTMLHGWLRLQLPTRTSPGS